MINILSIRCGLSFAPYLIDSVDGYLGGDGFASRVVKQGGSGLILRSAPEVTLRFQEREAALGMVEARHYRAALSFRRDHYDVARMSDEVVIASVGASLMLSHPQSELWFDVATVTGLLEVYGEERTLTGAQDALPDWLTASSSAGRLLLSDQRTGRWVLLGADHVGELERRAKLLTQSTSRVKHREPPTVNVKGVDVHLQSAFKLAEALEQYAESGDSMGIREQAPEFSLVVERTNEGLALQDTDRRVAISTREARKYAAIIRDELEQRRARQFERGGVRTVMADDASGRWVLQWGDEVLLGAAGDETVPRVGMRLDGEYVVLLEPASGACVVLTQMEAEAL